MSSSTADITWHEKFEAIRRVARYRPILTLGLIFLGAVVAFLEGVGLSFIYPILEVAQAEEQVADGGMIMQLFLSTYDLFGVPFSLGYLILGVAFIMTIRYTLSFVVYWLGEALGYRYEQHLRTRAFERALDAEISYYDDEGTDNILNAIITETRYSGKVIRKGVKTMETLFLVLMYLAVMFYITPGMTILAIVILGGITVFIRHGVEPAFTVGSRVAEANENVQETVQSGTQGIRDIKIFGLRSDVYQRFSNAIRKYADSSIVLARNDAAIKNFYNLAAALTLFALIYVGFTFTGLSLGELSIFLIAMFQLSPLVSQINSQLYKLEGYTSHLVRTQAFLDELERRHEDSGDKPVSTISQLEFDNVKFGYDENEQVLRGVSFAARRGGFIAFVGQSGAGKSTIVSLLARMYDPDSGQIRADGVCIDRYNIDQWRERIAVVRQDPYIFNDTLENNVTIGNQSASREEVKRVCSIAKVNEFLDDLPNGYESQLGDEGVRLSGGQKQRVALARALLKDADFLLLDEATSDLDSNLEKEVQEAIESMDREYGIIAIAHRLSTVENADEIYTLDNGKIIESGTHSELLADEGQYADLYTIQSSG